MFQEMELSSPKIKKFVIFSQKKAFLIFPEIERCSKKKKKSTLRKLLIFSQKKTFVIFRKTETPYILGNETFYVSGNRNPKNLLIFQKSGNPKNLLIFQEVTFRARKMETPSLNKIVIFQEMENISCTLGLLLGEISVK